MDGELVDPQLVVANRAIVGEGSLWDVQKKVLYWVDIIGHAVYIYDPKTKQNRTIQTCQSVGTVVPRAKGGLAVALHNGFATIDMETEKITPIADPERDIPGNRFNEGKCDPAGRFWAGTMDYFCNPGKGTLYCLDTDESVTKKISPVTVSNGITWSLDHKTMYFIDTGLDNVRAYDYDIDTGRISNERVVIKHDSDVGHFDGMSIDEEGMLWIAIWEGWGVKRYDPNTGKLLRYLRLPVQKTTSCAFGGEKMDELYVTSATFELDEKQLEDQPLAGSLIKVDPGVRGVPGHAYGG